MSDEISVRPSALVFQQFLVMKSTKRKTQNTARVLTELINNASGETPFRKNNEMCF